MVNGPLKITVFGGPTTNSDGAALSQRGMFLLSRPALSSPGGSFIVPEDYKNWNHFGTYDDLLSFEEDVCSIVDGVIVFLETEGAIAELGCLLRNEQVAHKLYVVVSNAHYQSDSFIKLGPLLFLENTYENVHVWHGHQLTSDDFGMILDGVKGRIGDRPKTESFRADNTRHVLSLIVDFVDLLQVARISDIQALLATLNISPQKKRLEQLLLSLKNIGLLREERVQKERCFIVDAEERPAIEYHFTSATAKRLSWKAKAFERTIEDKWRTYAFRSLKQAAHNSGSNNKNAA